MNIEQIWVPQSYMAKNDAPNCLKIGEACIGDFIFYELDISRNKLNTTLFMVI